MFYYLHEIVKYTKSYLKLGHYLSIRFLIIICCIMTLDRSRILTLNFDHFHNYNKKVKTLIILNSAAVINKYKINIQLICSL